MKSSNLQGVLNSVHRLFATALSNLLHTNQSIKLSPPSLTNQAIAWYFRWKEEVLHGNSFISPHPTWHTNQGAFNLGVSFFPSVKRERYLSHYISCILLPHKLYSIFFYPLWLLYSKFTVEVNPSHHHLSHYDSKKKKSLSLLPCHYHPLPSLSSLLIT